MSDKEKDNQQEKSPKSHKHFSRKKIFIIVASIILIISGVVGGLLYISYQKSVSETAAREAKVKQEAERKKIVDKASTEADKIVQNGGKISEAATIINRAIESTDDNLTKHRLNHYLAVMYYNDKKYEESLESALEAERIQETAENEQFISRVYERLGDEKMAIEYLEKAISHVDKSQPFAESDIDDYQYRIKSLGRVEN